MGDKFTTWQPAGDWERFAPGAFDSVIGQVVPLTYEGHRVGRCRLISAEVAADGSGAALLFEAVTDG